MTVEDEEILDLDIERVVCRWCGSADSIEEDQAAEERA
jgi:hypothetical protein